MTTSHVPTPVHLLEAADVPGPVWRTVTALLTGAIAASAYYGTWYLTEAIAMSELPVAPPDYLPGDGWGFGALALLLLVAAPMTVACLMAAMGHSAAASAAMVAGGLLMGWIFIQVLAIGLVFWLQPAMFLLGVVVLAMGMGGYRPAR